MPINVSTPTAPGVTYIVTGGGGAPLYPAGTSTWTAYSSSRYEYLRGSADSCTLEIEAVGRDASVFDSVALTRCGGSADTQPPTASITAPAAGATVSGIVTVDVTASDNVGVTGTKLLVDGGSAATDAQAPFQFALDSRLLSDGNHTLQARAYDAAGNAGSSTIITITVAKGTSPPQSSADIVLYAAEAPVRVGNWTIVSDTTAAGGSRLRNPDAGKAKIVTASSSPASYFEMTFSVNAGQAYHLWMRGKADSNSYANDSVFVQFDGSVNATGAPIYRIGTTSATEYILEDCSGCGLSNWGWQDNSYAGLGPDIYFANTGTQRLRLQVREDGLSIDQIVLSPSKYRTTSPGSPKNDTTILSKSVSSPPTNDTTVPVVSISAPADGATVASGSAVTVAATDNVQFSDAIDSGGAPIYRIGTTSATKYNLEDCGGCGLGGWGWQDNGYAGRGLDITFATSGTHTMRIQTREDGLSIDQIVLLPSRFLTTSPGALKNDTTILPKQ